jgi:hypothetical protein
MSKYIAALVDEKGTTWVFEGWVKENPIWTKRESANPKLISSEAEAWEIATDHALPNEIPRVIIS